MNKPKSLLAGGILAGLLLLFWSCGGQNGRQEAEFIPGQNVLQDAQGEPVLVFDTLIHDFGTIIEGEQVVCYFDYRNKGSQDLMITHVETTCGCTIPNWSQEPLGPGQKETLELIFDASGRKGEQRKQITVRSNTGQQVVRLTIRANVINNVS
jgi:hypothetical protein